jgi:hypothetical protein
VAKEAMERGKFIDIHDFGSVSPKDYDVLITDIDNNTLEGEISNLAGIPYLKEVTKDEADEMPKKIRGFAYGSKLRLVI